MADEVPEPRPTAPAWRTQSGSSLPEVHGSIIVPHDAPPWRKFLAFAGPGYLVAVGYMDPGNWATDLAGGVAVRLHAAVGHPDVEPDGHPAAARSAIKLGVVTGRDLAQACRDHYSAADPLVPRGCSARSPSPPATSPRSSARAIALQLLFGIPLLVGLR